MDGWLSDEKCIARQKTIKGNIMPIDNIYHYVEFEKAIELLENGQVKYHA